MKKGLEAIVRCEARGVAKRLGPVIGVQEETVRQHVLAAMTTAIHGLAETELIGVTCALDGDHVTLYSQRTM